jgi:DNA-binding MarR family transcriptional regulator
MNRTRTDTIRLLFENMSALKRGMQAQLQQTDGRSLIPHGQQEVLTSIRSLQPVSFKQLSTHLYLTPGAISQLVEGLEAHDLIRRSADPTDRRIQLLQISKKGTKLLQDIDKRRRKFLEATMSALTDEELGVWLNIQQKMIQQFQIEVEKNNK